jgi:AcrR family transcriptional regulator
MNGEAMVRSPRRAELLDLAYRYALQHGLGAVSIRPLAAAIGSSTGVLYFLFASKDGLLRAMLERVRADNLGALCAPPAGGQDPAGLHAAAGRAWSGLADPALRKQRTLWFEAYVRSLADQSGGPGTEFARASVDGWLAELAMTQPGADRDTPGGRAERTLTLAVLRGALMDLLATGDVERTTAAVRLHLTALRPEGEKRIVRGPGAPGGY